MLLANHLDKKKQCRIVKAEMKDLEAWHQKF